MFKKKDINQDGYFLSLNYYGSIGLMAMVELMKLYIKETGQDNQETIIFLHGGGLAGWMWEEQVKAFNDYHCLVPDLLNTDAASMLSHSQSKAPRR